MEFEGIIVHENGATKTVRWLSDLKREARRVVRQMGGSAMAFDKYGRPLVAYLMSTEGTPLTVWKRSA